MPGQQRSMAQDSHLHNLHSSWISHLTSASPFSLPVVSLRSLYSLWLPTLPPPQARARESGQLILAARRCSPSPSLTLSSPSLSPSPPSLSPSPPTSPSPPLPSLTISLPSVPPPASSSDATGDSGWLVNPPPAVKGARLPWGPQDSLLVLTGDTRARDGRDQMLRGGAIKRAHVKIEREGSEGRDGQHRGMEEIHGWQRGRHSNHRAHSIEEHRDEVFFFEDND